MKIARFDLNEDRTVHNFQDGQHPYDYINILIVGRAGKGEVRLRDFASRGLVRI